MVQFHLLEVGEPDGPIRLNSSIHGLIMQDYILTRCRSAIRHTSKCSAWPKSVKKSNQVNELPNRKMYIIKDPNSSESNGVIFCNQEFAWRVSISSKKQDRNAIL